MHRFYIIDLSLIALKSNDFISIMGLAFQFILPIQNYDIIFEKEERKMLRCVLMYYIINRQSMGI